MIVVTKQGERRVEYSFRSLILKVFWGLVALERVGPKLVGAKKRVSGDYESTIGIGDEIGMLIEKIATQKDDPCIRHLVPNSVHQKQPVGCVACHDPNVSDALCVEFSDLAGKRKVIVDGASR